jgi:hypothetical protein
MTRIMTAFAHELSIRGAIDVREAFVDASFAPAKKGGAKVGKTKRGKGTSWRLQIVMGCQFLFAQRAPPPRSEASYVYLATDGYSDAPQNLIGDNAYDSDRLDAELGSTELNSLLHIVGIVGTEGIRLRMEVG